MRHPLIHFTLLLTLLLAAACGPAAAPDAAAPSEPGAQAVDTAPAATRVEVLRLPGGDFGYPSPFGYFRGPGYARMSFIFDTLVWKDSSGEIIPWLAESWTSSDDGLSWTFTLREGVQWQDGEPLTADDVAFTFRYFTEQPNPWSSARADVVKEVEAVDARTVQVTLGRPYAPFLPNVAGSLPIIPQHIWEMVDDAKKFVDDKALIGSGPYRLVSYNKAEGAYLYEANDNFWLGAPYVQRIELIPVGDEALALKQGEVHAAGISGIVSAATEDLLKAFQEDSRFGMITAPGEWNLVLYFNEERGAPLNDRSFRQAVAYALDLQTMVDQVLFGDALPGTPGWLAPSNPWKNPDIGPYPYDADKARAMLEEAGYTDRDGDGVREAADGTPLKFELVYGNWFTPRPAEMIKAWLADVGIEIQLKSVDRVTSDQLTQEGQYALALVGHGGLGGDPDFMRTVFHSQSKSASFTRVRGYHNERFDELADKQLGTVDEAARRDMLYEMQSILAEDVPVIPLYYPNSNQIFDQTVLGNWYFTPGGFASGIPMTWNKHLFVTGMKTGLQINGQ